MNYSNIKYCDIANGEGVRTTLFVSGCRRHCKNCFNPETWSFQAGNAFTPEVERVIIDSLAPAYIDGLTILGGEPFEPENQAGLVEFLERVKRTYPQKTIWSFTGDTYEDIVDGPKHTDVSDRILACIDVLVDGEYIDDLYDITLRFRGSSNQRIIDIAKTRQAGCVVLWEDDPLFASHSMN